MRIDPKDLDAILGQVSEEVRKDIMDQAGVQLPPPKVKPRRAESVSGVEVKRVYRPARLSRPGTGMSSWIMAAAFTLFLIWSALAGIRCLILGK